MWLFALILGLPLLEIALFVTVGGWLGLWLTLGIVIGTAMLGTALIRRQGSRAQADLRAALQARRSPAMALAGDAMTVLAGVLLVLPGFFTDTLGLVLLIPPVQRAIAGRVARRAREQAAAQVRMRVWDSAARPGRPGQPDVIDATWEELPDPGPKPPSGWTRH